MDRLSSCYFCGATLDAQLSEYPVVPRRLQSEGADGTTVVLCQGCRRKLGNVVEKVVEAAESGERDGTSGYEGTGFEPIADEAANDSDGPLLGEDGTEETSQRTATEAQESSQQTGAESEESSQRADSERADASPSGRTADGRDSDRDTTDDAADDDGPSLTKLEYNKVMRLLKNREFPVDRMEIREVATSAYQIDPSEFDAVIDAALERGLIAEENGQFVDADGR